MSFVPLDVCYFLHRNRGSSRWSFLIARQRVQLTRCILPCINFASYSHDFRQLMLVSDICAGIQSPHKKIFTLLMRFPHVKYGWYLTVSHSGLLLLICPLQSPSTLTFHFQPCKCSMHHLAFKLAVRLPPRVRFFLAICLLMVNYWQCLCFLK